MAMSGNGSDDSSVSTAATGGSAATTTIGQPQGWASALSSLVIPVAWGLTLYFLLSAVLESGWSDNDLARRYLLGHPVSRITTAMFCIGLASLASVALDTLRQMRQTPLVKFTNIDADIDDQNHDNELTADQRLSQQLLQSLARLPAILHRHWLFERLVAILNYIQRNGATEGTENELKYLAESDQLRQQQRYSLVRILIWATPMLGFLGTVMGISQALGSLNVGPDNDLQKMMGGLQSSLYVAFDTTAQALVFSIALMFATFVAERFESQWLTAIDRQASELISSHFEFVTPANEASQSVYRLGRRMVAATRSAVREHTEIWRQTIHAAEHAWHGTQWQLSTELQTQWSQAIRESLDAWTVAIDHSTAEADERMALRWSQWQTTLSEFARTLEDRQKLANQQAATVNDILERLENLSSIHLAINQNLEALHSTSRLETALTGLTQVVAQLRWELGQQRQPSIASPAAVHPEVNATEASQSGQAQQVAVAATVELDDEPVILKLPVPAPVTAPVTAPLPAARATSVAPPSSTPVLPIAARQIEGLPRPQVIRLFDGARRAA